MYAQLNNRVMLVDDEEAVRLSWNRYLSERGFEVITAEDGDRAVTRLSQEPVDVVVSDLRMPGLDGLQLLEWLHDRKPNTPFILLTGYGSDEVEKRAKELGAYQYLNKPITPEALSAVITAATLLKKAEAAPALHVENVAPPKSAMKTFAQTVGGLVMAPILGLAFVIFLPVIGFGMLLKVMVEAIRTGK